MSRKHIIYDRGQLKSHFYGGTSQQRIPLSKFDAYSVAAFPPTTAPPSGSLASTSSLQLKVRSQVATPINNIAVALEGDWLLNQVNISYISVNGVELEKFTGYAPTTKTLLVNAGGLGSGLPVDPLYLYNWNFYEEVFTLDPDGVMEIEIAFPSTTFYLFSQYDGMSGIPLLPYTLSGPDLSTLGTESLYAYDFSTPSGNHQPYVCGVGLDYDLNAGSIGIPATPPSGYVETQPETISASGTHLWTHSILHQRVLSIYVALDGLTAGQTATLKVYGDNSLSFPMYTQNFTESEPENGSLWIFKNIQGNKLIYIEVENTSGSSITVSPFIAYEPF